MKNMISTLKKKIYKRNFQIATLALAFVAIGVYTLFLASAATSIIVPTGVQVQAAEGSGMVASRKYPGVFWWMRDGGPSTATKPREAIYAMKYDANGKIQPVRGSQDFPFNEITGTSNNNWEDIALDDDNNIWIGDIGANDCGRNNQKLFRVKEPDPTSSQKLTIDASYTFKFPDPKSGCNTWNSEAMFWLDGKMYIFAKTSNSPVYRVDLPSGNSGTAKLVRLGTLAGGVSNISVSSVSSDRTRLVVASHNRMNVYKTTKTGLKGDDLVKDLISRTPSYVAEFDCKCSSSTAAVEGGAFRPGTYDIAFVAETKYTYYAMPPAYGDKSTGTSQTSDTTPPNLEVPAPAENSTVSGTITIEVNVTDNVGVEGVDISHENGVIRYGTSQGDYGWGSRFDTRNISDGQHVITVTAHDKAGNQSTVKRTINVKNSTDGTTPPPTTESDSTPPTVSFAGPAASSTVSGTITLEVNASDNTAIESVYIFYDKNGIIREGTSQGNYGWGSQFDTRKLPNGAHTFEAIASDAAGNVGIAKITLNIQN